MYDLIIIGAGPAGSSAGIYAARKKIKTLLMTESLGGQSITSSEVKNWIGEISISGFDLAKKIESHLKSYDDIEIKDGERAVKVEKTDSGFRVFGESGSSYETKTILMASGSSRKKINVPGERELDGRGVFYCSICDAPLMKDKVAAVIGGGNAGFGAVIDLLPYAKKIYLLHRRNELRGDALTEKSIRDNPKVEIILNVDTKEIVGNGKVEKLIYLDKNSGEEKTLSLDGIFIEIGAVPNSDIVKDIVSIDEKNEIIINHKTGESSLKGIWAAGDVSDVLYKQNNISAGDAIKAVLNIYDYLKQ